MGSELDEYLKLESLMLGAEDEDFREALQDMMDLIWYSLSVKDRCFLNNRGRC